MYARGLVIVMGRVTFKQWCNYGMIISMITDQDIEKLKGVFATKDDIANMATKDDIADIESRMVTKDDFEGLKEMVQGIAVGVDKLMRAEESRKIEDASMKVKTDRHETWIKTASEKIDVPFEV